MDPLSISAAVIAVLGAGTTAIKTVQEVKVLLRESSSAIKHLRIELDELHLILLLIQHYNEASVQRDASLVHALQHARGELSSLDDLVWQKLIRSFDTNGNPIVSRLQWAKRRRTIRTKLNSLRQLRQNITLLMIIQQARSLQDLCQSMSAMPSPNSRRLPPDCKLN